jgi:hypothetical protein
LSKKYELVGGFDIVGARSLVVHGFKEISGLVVFTKNVSSLSWVFVVGIKGLLEVSFGSVDLIESIGVADCVGRWAGVENASISGLTRRLAIILLHLNSKVNIYWL